MPDIEIYTQPGCPYCTRAKRLLDAKSVAYREIDAPGGSPARAESLQRSGSSSVPQIFVDGRYIGDSDELTALDRGGKLDAILAAA